ncbi:MAG: ABC transporter permease subunit [Firmicutes bacterium]|nr:ABC transporter permease subunit [Bacillota bacterium]
MKKTGITMLSIFILFLGWIIVFAVVNNPLLLPSPLAVFKAFFELFTNLKTLQSMGATILRLLLALTIAFIIGVALGLLSGFYPKFATFCSPIVTILRTVPVISIVVIMLILFGFETTPYLITFFMIFPIIYQATFGGIKQIDSELVDVYKLEDNRIITGLKYCYIPLIQSQVKTALLQSAGLGIKVLVMAEFLAQTKNSIGNQLYLSKVNLAYDQVFAWTLLLIFLAVILELLINRYAVIKNKITNDISVKKSITD